MSTEAAGHIPSIVRGSTRLRQMLKDPKKLVVAPGVYDGITARSFITCQTRLFVQMAGRKTGAGTSMSKLGWADLGIATLNDMKQNAEMIANLNPNVPVIADADTGYGGPVMVARTVEAYSRAGIAALHFEDQVQTKRCGHLLGKQLVDRDTYISRICAAVAARERIGSDILIIARTDARQSYGFEEAAERLQEAVRYGADAVFLEGFETVEEGRKIVQIMGDTPVMLNMVGSGVTPEISIEEAKEIGFRIMIYPAILMGPVIETCKTILSNLKKEGTQPKGIMGPRECFVVCGLQECMDIDKAAGGIALEDI